MAAGADQGDTVGQVSVDDLPQSDPSNWCASVTTSQVENARPGAWSGEAHDSESILRSHRDFLAMLAHELRNPLAAINNAVQVWLRSDRQEDVAWIKDVIHRQSQHLSRLIDDLLDLSFVTRGTTELRKQRVAAAETTLEAPPRPEPDRPQPDQATLRVLLVEDHCDAAGGLAKLLRMSGYLVMTAGDGTTAIDLARTERPDAILLDIGLPGMDGYQVAERLRNDEGSENILFVAISSYVQDHDRRRSRAAGFDHHLVKPVDMERLLNILATRCMSRPTSIGR